MDPIEMTQKGAQELAQLLQVLQVLRATPAARVLISVSLPAEPGDDGYLGMAPHCLVSRTHLIELLTQEERHIGKTLARVLGEEYPTKE